MQDPRIDAVCSNCEKVLAHIIKTYDADIQCNIIVHCPFCKDKSFIIEVDGLFSYCGTDEVAILEVYPEGDTIQITTVVKPNDGNRS